MKIATWNVNSIRVRAEQVARFLDYAKPDVLCLQEIKTVEESFPAESFAELGYRSAVFGQRTYNGVALLTREEPEALSRGFPHLAADHPLNRDSRLLAATVGGIRVVTFYVPNGEAVGSPKYDYKLAWLAEARTYFDRFHRKDEPLVLCGDMNVAPEDIDLYDPEARAGDILVSPAEREALARVKAFGFEDCFRLKTSEGGRYSWWDYRGGMYWKGMGIRLDHLWATPPLASRLTDCDIDERPRRWKRPSDHTVVWADFGP